MVHQLGQRMVELCESLCIHRHYGYCVFHSHGHNIQNSRSCFDMAERTTAMTNEINLQSGEVRVDNVSRTYIDAHGSSVEALRDVSLTVKPGELVSLIGPSGCGKTTLMRLIAGLDHPQSGESYLDGEVITTTHYE